MLKKMTYPIFGVLALALLCTGVVQADLVNLTASADTYVRGPGDSVDKNYGISTQLLVGTLTPGSKFMHMLLRFDLSGISATDTINSATLTTIADGNDGSSQSTASTLNVFELVSANSNWDEGTAAGTDNNDGATWLKKDSQTVGPLDWAGGANGAGLAGTDYINTSLASFTDVAKTIATGTTMTFTSTSDLLTAISNNAGGSLDLIVSNDDTARNFFRIASSEDTTYAGPSLSVNFTTAVPEPSSFAFLGLVSFGLLVKKRRTSGELCGETM